MKRYLTLLVFLISACNTKKQDITQVCKPGFKPAETLEANTQSASPTFTTDDRTVTLSLRKFNSTSFPQDGPVADSALHIASVLLSSKDFKQTLSGLTFTCHNYRNYCKENCSDCSGRFNGSVVLDSAYREKEVKLDLFLRDCNNEYGHSTKNIREVYSCQSVVFYDEPRLSPAYCYAYHIAHEYMHIVGFFHTDHKDDVAEKIGWLGWEILLKWRQGGIDVMKLQPGQR